MVVAVAAQSVVLERPALAMSNPRAATPGPFPILSSPHPTASCSRRVRQRNHRAAHHVHSCNSIFSGLNDLHRSYSSSRQDASSFIFPPAVTDRAIAHVRDCAMRFDAATRPSAASAAVVSEGLPPVPAFSAHATPVTAFSAPGPTQPLPSPQADAVDIIYTSTGYGNQPSVPIIASKVSLPSAAGTAVLHDLLPPLIAERYEDPRNVLRRPCEHLERAAAVPIRDQPEYERLIVRMLGAGMISFTRTPAIVNGIFCVPKDGGQLRLIVDARRCNAIFEPAPAVHLPTPDLLGKLTAPTDRTFFVAGDDCDNFYHRLKLPVAWVPFFALPPVSAAAVGVADVWGLGFAVSMLHHATYGFLAFGVSCADHS